MRYIKFPDDVTLKQPDGTPIENAKPISFVNWLQMNVLSDAKLGKTSKDLMMAADIKQKLESDGPDPDMVELSDAEWTLLKGVIEEPTGGYNPIVAIQMTSFMRAFLDAPDEDPRKKLKSVEQPKQLTGSLEEAAN